MELLISIILGSWISLAGVAAYIRVTNEFKEDKTEKGENK